MLRLADDVVQVDFSFLVLFFVLPPLESVYSIMEDILDGRFGLVIRSLVVSARASAMTPEMPVLPILDVLPKNLSRKALLDASLSLSCLLIRLL